MNRKIYQLLGIMLVVLFSSCNKNIIDEGKFTLKISVQEIEESAEIYVWFTNSNNEVIYEQKVKNNNSYELDSDDVFIGNKTSFHYFFSSEYRTQINSYLNVNKGDITIVEKFDNPIRIKLNYHNFKTDSGLLGSKRFIHSGSFIEKTYVFDDNRDIYIRTGDNFQFFSDLKFNEINDLFFTGTESELLQKSVMSSSGKLSFSNVKAYYLDNAQLKGVFVDNDNALNTQKKFLLPVSNNVEFFDYMLSFERKYFYEVYSYGKEWYNYYTGSLPTVASKINADISSAELYNDTITYTVDGNYDFAIVHTNNSRARWKCVLEGNKPVFPKLPKGLTNDFVDRSIFFGNETLFEVHIYEDSEVSNYKDVLDKLFNRGEEYTISVGNIIKKEVYSGHTTFSKNKNNSYEDKLSLKLRDDYIPWR